MHAFGLRLSLTLAISAAAMVTAEPAARAFDCTSMNPADWPEPARPYFLLMVGTSTTMTTAVVGAPASCTVNGASYGTDRRAHARCALRTAIEAHGDQIQFGLATYARTISGCSDMGNGLCNFDACMHANFTGSADGGCASGGCGPEPDPGAVNSATRSGAFIRVPLVPQTTPPQPSNVPDLVAWMDGSCADSRELFASGCTPVNGMLRDAFRYYSNQWIPPAPVPGGGALPSPLTSAANGERACRSLHVVLVLDGNEACDASNDAVDAAADLFAGFVKDGIQWRVKTHVVLFAGGDQASADAIAAAGGTGTSLFATNEAQLSLALAQILDASLVAETCDNVDNDCNGCADEGFVHYCNVQPVPQNCCTWTTPAQRNTCLNNYKASNPKNPKLLPCTTPTQAQQPNIWLCFDPGDACDGVDNNCAGGVDTGCVGTTCTDASAWQSGFCIDSVCCDTACGGSDEADCSACSVAAGAAVNGTCAALEDGAACIDGDACTLTDVCQDGACTGTEDVLCPPPDDCHEAAACVPESGECAYVPKPDGSPCDDGDPCTQVDICTAAACAGGTPMACAPQDDCHEVGVCDPESTGTTNTGNTNTGNTNTDSSSGSGPATDGAPQDGCGCQGTAPAPSGTLLTLALAAAWRRRRASLVGGSTTLAWSNYPSCERSYGRDPGGPPADAAP